MRYKPFFQHIVIFTAVFFATIFIAESVNFDVAEEVYEAHGAHAATLKASVEDQELKEQPDISTFLSRYMPFDVDLLAAYAQHRVRDKLTQGGEMVGDEWVPGPLYPGMTLAHAESLNGNRRFIGHFVTFLQNWGYTEFVEGLETRALELSRSEPTAEYPRGLPQIDPVVRQSNRAFVSKYTKLHDALYEPLDIVMREYSAGAVDEHRLAGIVEEHIPAGGGAAE